MEKYYKILAKDGKSTQANFDYSQYLPKNGRKGKWLPKINNLKICDKGYHITKYWNMWYKEGYRIYEVEYKGMLTIEDHCGVEEKAVCETIRLVKDATEELVPSLNGYYNTGNYNTGNCNTGDFNTGNRNTGYRNTGYCNTGYYNTGNCNTGDFNTGNRNTGYCNTGDYNTGNCNTGDFNTGNRNTGYFNTTTPKIRMFNKETDLNFGEIDFPNWIFVRNLTKDAFREAFTEADCDDVEKTLELPNFDYAIFEEITGISKSDFDKKLAK